MQDRDVTAEMWDIIYTQIWAKIVGYVDLRNFSIYCAALWICLRNILAALICKFSTFLSQSKSIYSKIGSWRQRQRERQKSNRCRFAKQQLCTCITLFCTFLCRHCTTTKWKCLISLFGENENTRERLCFFFSLTSTRSYSIQLQKNLATWFDKLNEVE